MGKLSKSSFVFAAENDIKDAASYSQLFRFNFPSEAKECILSLHHAIEMLLQEHYQRRSIKLRGMKKLINNYDDWDYQQKDQIRWITYKRNDLQHKGEMPWEEAEIVGEKIKDVFLLAGELYTNLGFSLKEVFSSLERAYLLAQEPDWQDKADALSQAAINYVSIDPEIAVEIANYASEVAFRGFASSWQIEGAHTLPISELKSMMDEYSDEGSSYYEDRRDERDTYRDFPIEGFNKSFHELETHGREGGPEVSALYYAQEIREAVLSYLERALIIAGVHMRDNWDSVVEELLKRYPEIEIPNVNRARWDLDYSLLLGKKIFIPLVRGSDPPDWDEADISRIREVISDLYGDIL